MKSFSMTSRLFLFVLAITLFTACDPQFQEVFKASLSPQAKNATDVLPADVAMVAMLNTQDLKSNEYTNVFGDNGLLDEAPDEAMAHMQDFIAATGFDPEQDLDAVYVAASHLGNKSSNTMSMVAYANLDAEELKAYIAQQAGDKLQSRTYRGVDIFEYDHAESPAFSVVNNDMILAASNGAGVEAMIDRLEGEGASLASNDAMMELVGRASAGQSAWFVTRKPAIDPSGSPANDLQQTALQIWSAVDYVVGALNIEAEGLDGQVFVYPNAGVSADDLSSLMNGLIAAAKANPELEDKDLDMLDDMRAEARGEYVHLGMFVDNSLIQKVKG